MSEEAQVICRAREQPDASVTSTLFVEYALVGMMAI